MSALIKTHNHFANVHTKWWALHIWHRTRRAPNATKIELLHNTPHKACKFHLLQLIYTMQQKLQDSILPTRPSLDARPPCREPITTPPPQTSPALLPHQLSSPLLSSSARTDPQFLANTDRPTRTTSKLRALPRPLLLPPSAAEKHPRKPSSRNSHSLSLSMALRLTTTNSNLATIHTHSPEFAPLRYKRRTSPDPYSSALLCSPLALDRGLVVDATPASCSCSPGAKWGASLTLCLSTASSRAPTQSRRAGRLRTCGSSGATLLPSILRFPVRTGCISARRRKLTRWGPA